MDRLKKCPGYEQGGFSEEQIGMLCKVADHQILYPEKKKEKKKKKIHAVSRKILFMWLKVAKFQSAIS